MYGFVLPEHPWLLLSSRLTDVLTGMLWLSAGFSFQFVSLQEQEELFNEKISIQNKQHQEEIRKIKMKKDSNCSFMWKV